MQLTSKDGTRISVRVLGSGPGLVLLHGAMETGADRMQLAQRLSGSFTCYVPDRRGRGASGPAGDRYGLEREVEDLSALMDASGATRVLGVSSGAIITLRTALVRPDLSDAIIFEPPFYADTSATDRLRRVVAGGDLTGALVMGMKYAKLGPPGMASLPEWVLRPLTAAMSRKQPQFRALAPTLVQDFTLVAETAADLSPYARVTSRVLLLGGGRSAAYLKRGLTELEAILPDARRVELAGVGHEATGPAELGGKPEKVAETVHAFLDI